MRLRLIRTHETPPGGWVWSDPETKQTFTAVAFTDLVAKAIDHRKANGLRIPADFREMVMHQNGERMLTIEPSLVEADDGDNPVVKAARFLRAVGRWAASGFKTVTEAQYDQRVETCTNCHFFRGVHNFHASCGKCGCSGLKLWLATEKCPDGKWRATA